MGDTPRKNTPRYAHSRHASSRPSLATSRPAVQPVVKVADRYVRDYMQPGVGLEYAGPARRVVEGMANRCDESAPGRFRRVGVERRSAPWRGTSGHARDSGAAALRRRETAGGASVGRREPRGTKRYLLITCATSKEARGRRDQQRRAEPVTQA